MYVMKNLHMEGPLLEHDPPIDLNDWIRKNEIKMKFRPDRAPRKRRVAPC